MTDASGIYLGAAGGPSVGVGDYVRSEKHFVFSVYVSTGGVEAKAGEYKASQITVAKKKANTGTTANDWDGNKNEYQQGFIGCTTDEAEVRAMVGGTLPIQIDPNANN